MKQLLTDIQSCNDNNPAFANEPIDVGRYIVQLKRFDDVIAKVEAAVNAGEPTVPAEVLDPLCEEW